MPLQIVIAGGNLVFGVLAPLLGTGETITSNRACDPFIPVARYPNRANPKDLRASPVFATFPVLIQVGQDEVLLSVSKVLAEKTAAVLDVWSHVPHVWQLFDGFLPEANAVKFVQTSFESASR